MTEPTHLTRAATFMRREPNPQQDRTVPVALRCDERRHFASSGWVRCRKPRGHEGRHAGPGMLGWYDR